MAELSEEPSSLTAEPPPVDHPTTKPRASDSSDSDNESPTLDALKAKAYRIFGRQRPVHAVLGGGKPADLVLWRDKKASGAVLAGATVVWVLFEMLEYHLLPVVCHALIFSLAAVFLWSNAISLMQKTPPKVPEMHIPEQLATDIAMSLRADINRVLALLRGIASGREHKKFLAVIAGLWILSNLGSCCNFMTLFYIVFVLLHTVPVLYEKYDDTVDSFAEKAMAWLKQQYAVVDSKLLSKIPRRPLKDKEH